jgi:hypothetical protein
MPKSSPPSLPRLNRIYEDSFTQEEDQDLELYEEEEEEEETTLHQIELYSTRVFRELVMGSGESGIPFDLSEVPLDTLPSVRKQGTPITFEEYESQRQQEQIRKNRTGFIIDKPGLILLKKVQIIFDENRTSSSSASSSLKNTCTGSFWDVFNLILGNMKTVPYSLVQDDHTFLSLTEVEKERERREVLEFRWVLLMKFIPIFQFKEITQQFLETGSNTFFPSDWAFVESLLKDSMKASSAHEKEVHELDAPQPMGVFIDPKSLGSKDRVYCTVNDLLSRCLNLSKVWTGNLDLIQIIWTHFQSKGFKETSSFSSSSSSSFSKGKILDLLRERRDGSGGDRVTSGSSSEDLETSTVYGLTSRFPSFIVERCLGVQPPVKMRQEDSGGARIQSDFELFLRILFLQLDKNIKPSSSSNSGSGSGSGFITGSDRILRQITTRLFVSLPTKVKVEDEEQDTDKFSFSSSYAKKDVNLKKNSDLDSLGLKNVSALILVLALFSQNEQQASTIYSRLQMLLDFQESCIQAKRIGIESMLILSHSLLTLGFQIKGAVMSASDWLFQCCRELTDLEQQLKSLDSSSSTSFSTASPSSTLSFAEISRKKRLLSDAISSGLESVRLLVSRVTKKDRNHEKKQENERDGPVIALHELISQPLLHLLDTSKVVPSELRLKAISLVSTLAQSLLHKHQTEDEPGDSLVLPSVSSSSFLAPTPAPAPAIETVPSTLLVPVPVPLLPPVSSQMDFDDNLDSIDMEAMIQEHNKKKKQEEKQKQTEQLEQELRSFLVSSVWPQVLLLLSSRFQATTLLSPSFLVSPSTSSLIGVSTRLLKQSPPRTPSTTIATTSNYMRSPSPAPVTSSYPSSSYSSSSYSSSSRNSISWKQQHEKEQQQSRWQQIKSQQRNSMDTKTFHSLVSLLAELAFIAISYTTKEETSSSLSSSPSKSTSKPVSTSSASPSSYSSKTVDNRDKQKHMQTLSSWKQIVEDFGPSSSWISKSLEMEQRQVSLIFFTRLLSLAPRILLPSSSSSEVDFEIRVLNLWLLSMMEYRFTDQLRFTLYISSSAPIGGMIYRLFLESAKKCQEMTSHTTVDDFFQNRRSFLASVIRGLGIEWRHAIQKGRLSSSCSSYSSCSSPPPFSCSCSSSPPPSPTPPSSPSPFHSLRSSYILLFFVFRSPLVLSTPLLVRFFFFFSLLHFTSLHYSSLLSSNKTANSARFQDQWQLLRDIRQRFTSILSNLFEVVSNCLKELDTQRNIHYSSSPTSSLSSRGGGGGPALGSSYIAFSSASFTATSSAASSSLPTTLSRECKTYIQYCYDVMILLVEHCPEIAYRTQGDCVLPRFFSQFVENTPRYYSLSLTLMLL